jgi:hypothetical protein
VKVGGCPYKERCDYLALFAMGSLIGKATKIDMEYTRSHDEVRMFVEVTDINHIPTGDDHVYEGQGYGLTFEVEGGITQASIDIDMDANVDDEGDPKEERKNEDMGNPNDSLNSKPKSDKKQVDGSSQSGKQVASTPLTMQFGTIGIPSKIALASAMEIPRSLLCGDRVEEEEDLPAPLCASAPPRVPSFTPAMTRDECIAAAKSPKPAAAEDSGLFPATAENSGLFSATAELSTFFDAKISTAISVGDAHCLSDDFQHDMDGDNIASSKPNPTLLSDEQEAHFPPVTSQTPPATPTRLKSPQTPNVVPAVWPATPTTNMSRGQDGT